MATKRDWLTIFARTYETEYPMTVKKKEENVHTPYGNMSK